MHKFQTYFKIIYCAHQSCLVSNFIAVEFCNGIPKKMETLNNSEVKQSFVLADVCEPVNRLPTEMFDFEEELFVVGERKDSVRYFKQEPLQDPKMLNLKDIQMQIFYLKQALEKEREISSLMTKRFVSKQRISDDLENDCATISRGRFKRQTGDAHTVKKDGENIEKETKKRLVEENEFLKHVIDQFVQKEENISQDLQCLKDRNQELILRDFAKSFVNDIIVNSLHTIISEQENQRVIKRMQEELKELSKQNELYLVQQIAMEERAFNAEKATTELQKFIEEAETRYWEEEEKSVSVQYMNQLKSEVFALKEKLGSTEHSLVKSNEEIQGIKSENVELSLELSYWKSKAVLFEVEGHSKEDLIGNLKDENARLECKYQGLHKLFMEETRRFNNQIAALNREKSHFQKDKEELLLKIMKIESKNLILENIVGALNKLGDEQMSKNDALEEQIFLLQEENQHLDEVIDRLTRKVVASRRGPWWRRLS